MRSIILLSFCLSVWAVFDYKAFQNIRYTDNILGQLIVSQQRFPLLTPVSEPETIFVVPTGAQMKELETILNRQQGKRRKRAGLDSLADMKETVKKFLVQQFGNEVAVPPVPQPSNDLPFTSFVATSKFEVVWLPKMTFYQYMFVFLTKMQNVFAGKNWFPSNELSYHVSLCGYPDMQSYTAILEGIRFDTTVGGTMAYFQVSCIKKEEDVIVGISYYGTTFGIKSIAQEKKVTKDWNALFNNAKKTGASTSMYEQRTLTKDQMNLLFNYLRGFLMRNINQLFRDYLQITG